MQIQYTTKRGFYLVLSSGQPYGNKRRKGGAEEEEAQEPAASESAGPGPAAAGRGQPAARAAGGGAVRVPQGKWLPARPFGATKSSSPQPWRNPRLST